MLSPFLRFQASDLPRFEPAHNLHVRLAKFRKASRWPNAKFFSILVGYPTVLVSALLGNERKATVPIIAIFRSRLPALGRTKFNKLALALSNIRGGVKHVAALQAFPRTGRLHAMAFRAKPGALRLRILVFGKFERFAALAPVEFGEIYFHYKTKAKMIASIVEQKRMVFARGRSKRAANRLNKPNAAFRRAAIANAPDIQVESRVQGCNIGYDPRYAVAETLENFLTLVHFREAVDIFSGNPRLDEPFLQMLSEFAIHAIDQRRQISSLPHPSRDDVSNQFRPIARSGQPALTR